MTYPASTEADAKNRAWRTLGQGLLLDVATVIVVALAAAMTDVQWTREYWLGVAALLGKSVVQSIISYFARKVVPPAVR